MAIDISKKEIKALPVQAYDAVRDKLRSGGLVFCSGSYLFSGLIQHVTRSALMTGPVRQSVSFGMGLLTKLYDNSEILPARILWRGPLVCRAATAVRRRGIISP